jgi:nucleoside-diphosphate-sugar epimerase
MIVAQQLCARCRRRVKRSYGDVAPVIVDALDQKALEDAVRRAAPTHVVHELTALPKAGARRASDLEPTNRLRDEATRNLLAAAIAARAQRIVVGSFALIGSAAGALTSDGQDMSRRRKDWSQPTHEPSSSHLLASSEYVRQWVSRETASVSGRRRWHGLRHSARYRRRHHAPRSRSGRPCRGSRDRRFVGRGELIGLYRAP